MKNPAKKKIALFNAAISCIALSTAATNAAIVLSEDFESPDVATVSSQTLPESGDWASNQSFNGIQKYIWDESYTYDIRGAATDPGPSTFSTPNGEQAYLFGYSSAVGITSLTGRIGSFTAAVSPTLNFLMGKPSAEPDPTAEIFFYLYAINTATVSDGDRAASNFNGTSGTDYLLIDSGSRSESSSTLQAKQWLPTVNAPDSYGTDVTGWDFALRITGDNFNYPIIDDIQFDNGFAIPEPSSAALIGTFGLLLIVRRRRHG